MKIKLLKDIPGYSAGTIQEVPNTTLSGYGHSYKVPTLIERGWAEEIKDDIDIEQIREKKKVYAEFYVGIETEEELQFFSAYRIVKAVIEKLNGDWFPFWNNTTQLKYDVGYSNSNNRFELNDCKTYQSNIIPHCKDEETARKVISLCEPELRILFSVDKKV